MDLRGLRSFAAAAEQGSFTAAAKQLHLTQAAISQHIAALEKELRAPLFDRQGRGVRLTEAGEQLHRYAGEILDLVDEALRKVGPAATEVSGVLRIAASTVPAEGLLPQLLADFRQQFPEVRESVVVSDSQLAIAEVECGQADIGFVGELPDSAALEAEPVAQDELVLVVARNHRLAGRQSVMLPQLKEEPLIVREPGSGTRRCLERALTEHGQSPADWTIALEVNSNDAIRAAVGRGMGIAFVSRPAAESSDQLVIVPVRGFRPRRQLYAIYCPARAPSRPARAFRQFLTSWQDTAAAR